jgi:hypothetical protein
LVTVLHGLSYLLSSYTASTSVVKAWWMLLGYQAAVAVILAGFSYFSYLCSDKSVEMPARCITGAVEGWGRFLPSLLVLCCIGLAFHAYSKLALVNFHLSNCIGELRNAWITTSHDQIPIFRRVTSVIGHLLSSFAYAGLFFALYRYSIGARKMVSFLFASAFFLAGVMYAFFIGSQNAILALLVVSILAIGLGAISVQAFWRAWGGRLAVILWFMLLAAFLSLSAFDNRVHCGDGVASVQTFRHYEEAFFDEIPMRKKETIAEVSVQVRRVCNACNAIFIYLNHGIYNFAHIASQDNLRGDPVFFNFFRGAAKRFGFPIEEKVNKPRVYGLGGATLPGSAYHDFGFSGMVVVGIVHALLAILAGGLLRSGSLQWEGVGLVLYVAVGFVTALSMMFVGFNIIAFPFVVWSAAAAMAVLIAWVKMRDIRIRELPGTGSAAAAPSGLSGHMPAQNARLHSDEVLEK